MGKHTNFKAQVHVYGIVLHYLRVYCKSTIICADYILRLDTCTYICIYKYFTNLQLNPLPGCSPQLKCHLHHCIQPPLPNGAYPPRWAPPPITSEQLSLYIVIIVRGL